MFRHVLCISDLFNTLNTKGSWVLPKALSAFNKMIIVFLQFIYVVDYIHYHFLRLSLPIHPDLFHPTNSLPSTSGFVCVRVCVLFKLVPTFKKK